MEHFTQLLSWAQQSPLQATFYGLVLAFAVKKLLFADSIPAVKKIAPPIKNPKRDVVYLFQFTRTQGINSSPYCLKLETYLRMADIPFEVVRGEHYFKSPRRKLPFIQLNDQIVSDSSTIIEFLIQKFGDKLDANLTSKQKALSLSTKILVENHLSNIMVYYRWIHPSGWPQWSKANFSKPITSLNLLRWHAALLIPRWVQNQIRKDLWSIGTTRYTDEELLTQAREDLNALAYLLGDEHFLFGDEFHAVDAAVYGVLTQFYGMKLDTPLHQLGARYGSLHEYYKRISELLETKPPLKITSI